jgi:phosphatidylinositol alpha-1,6-mannosyltransferase
MHNRYVFIAIDFAPGVGGIAQYLYSIVSRLPSEEVSVIALPSPGCHTFDSKQPFLISRLDLLSNKYSFAKITRKFLGLLFFLHLLRLREPGFIICCQCDQALLLAAWLLHKVKGSSYVVFAYGNDILLAQSKWYRRFFTTWLKSAQDVIAISQMTAQIVADFGVAPENLQILHPCVERSKFGAQLTQETQLTGTRFSDKKLFMTVGRLIERKGHDVVLRALPTIIDQIPDAHYLIVGSGPNEIRLRQVVTELGVSDAVTFTGYVPDDKLSSFYHGCKLFVMVSREIEENGDMEGFGIVYLEANLFGKPVIAGASGGVEDAVINGETGFLVNPTDETAVANAIIHLLKDSELATRLGQQGQERVLREFDCDTAVEKFLSTLERHIK